MNKSKSSSYFEQIFADRRDRNVEILSLRCEPLESACAAELFKAQQKRESVLMRERKSRDA